MHATLASHVSAGSSPSCVIQLLLMSLEEWPSAWARPPHGRPRWSSGLLALAQTSPSHCDYLGVSQWKSVLPLYHSNITTVKERMRITEVLNIAFYLCILKGKDKINHLTPFSSLFLAKASNSNILCVLIEQLNTAISCFTVIHLIIYMRR